MSCSNSSARGDKPLVEPLAFTVHSIGVPPADDALRRTRSGRLKTLLVLAVCAAPVLASYFTYFVIRPEGSASQGTLIQPARPMPPLALRTLDGTAVDAASLKGQWLLLVVGPADCDAACERRLYMQRQLREMLGRERDRLDKVWLITDRGEVAPALRTALAATPAMHLLHTDRAALEGWLAAENGHGLADHLYLVDPRGDWMLRFAADAEPSRIRRDLDRLLRVAAPWDAPGR